jgi:hypothetical protein
MLLCWNRPAYYSGRWSRRMVEHDSRTKPTADALSRSRAPTWLAADPSRLEAVQAFVVSAFTERGPLGSRRL